MNIINIKKILDIAECFYNWCIGLNPEEKFKVIALFGAVLAFVVSLLQYRKAQRWKRAEWVAQEMQAFFNDPAVNSALKMLDWGSRPIELYPQRKREADRFVVVRDDDLAKALAWHEDREEGFTEVEIAIRDAFDHFLERVERINSFVDTRLVALRDIRPYLAYWAEDVVLARAGDPKVDRLVQLRRYIRHYRYSGVEKLLTKLCRRAFPAE